jgi:hypothetical protein
MHDDWRLWSSPNVDNPADEPVGLAIHPSTMFAASRTGESRVVRPLAAANGCCGAPTMAAIALQ